MTTKDVLTELVKTADLFGVELSEARIEVYLESLDDLSRADVCAAFRVLRRSAKFFPRPGDVRQMIHGDPEELAEELWMQARSTGREDVRRALSTTEQAALRTAVNAVGGWPMLTGQAQETRIQFIHREFVRAAALALKNGQRTEAMTHQRRLVSGPATPVPLGPGQPPTP